VSGFLAGVCGWLAATILVIGYPGIALLMAIESSFIPFPSELVMPPAGYQIFEGKMSWALVIAAGTGGSILGAYINYALAAWLGRPFFLKFGRYFLISEDHIARSDRFFARHGEITMFVGRLIPVVRQLISLPAGVCRMNLLKFTCYTALGAGIWVTVLTWIGYEVGRNQELLHRYLSDATLIALGAVVVIVFVYIRVQRRRARRSTAAGDAD